MSQRWWQTELDGKAIEVLCGWDRYGKREPGHYFLVIELIASGDTIFSNMNLTEPKMALEHVISELQFWDINYPDSLVNDLKQDANFKDKNAVYKYGTLPPLEQKPNFKEQVA